MGHISRRFWQKNLGIIEMSLGIRFYRKRAFLSVRRAAWANCTSAEEKGQKLIAAETAVFALCNISAETLNYLG